MRKGFIILFLPVTGCWLFAAGSYADTVYTNDGRETRGIPARADMAIRAARKMREMLGMEPRHTVACADCFHLCREKRLSFEKSVKKWRIGAAAFVLLLLCGALFYGRLEPWLAAPALAGAALMLLVPYGNYFPAFEGAEKN